MSDYEGIPSEWSQAFDQFHRHIAHVWDEVGPVHRQVAEEAKATGVDPELALVVSSVAAIGSYLNAMGWKLIPPDDV